MAGYFLCRLLEVLVKVPDEFPYSFDPIKSLQELLASQA